MNYIDYLSLLYTKYYTIKINIYLILFNYLKIVFKKHLNLVIKFNYYFFLRIII